MEPWCDIISGIGFLRVEMNETLLIAGHFIATLGLVNSDLAVRSHVCLNVLEEICLQNTVAEWNNIQWKYWLE